MGSGADGPGTAKEPPLPPELAGFVAHLQALTAKLTSTYSLASETKVQAQSADGRSRDAAEHAARASEAAAEALANAAAAITSCEKKGSLERGADAAATPPQSSEAARPVVQEQQQEQVTAAAHKALEERIAALEMELLGTRQEMQRAIAELHEAQRPSLITPAARRRVGSAAASISPSIASGLESRPNSPSTVAVISPRLVGASLMSPTTVLVNNQLRGTDMSSADNSPDLPGVLALDGVADSIIEQPVLGSGAVPLDVAGCDAVLPAAASVAIADDWQEVSIGGLQPIQTCDLSPVANAIGVSEQSVSLRTEGALRDIQSTRGMVEAAERALKRVQTESITAQSVVSRLQTQAEQWRNEARQARELRKSVAETVEQLVKKARTSETQVSAIVARAELREDMLQRSEEAALVRADTNLRKRMQQCEHTVQEFSERTGARLNAFEDGLKVHSKHLEAIIAEQHAVGQQMFASQDAAMKELQRLEAGVHDLRERFDSVLQSPYGAFRHGSKSSCSSTPATAAAAGQLSRAPATAATSCTSAKAGGRGAGTGSSAASPPPPRFSQRSAAGAMPLSPRG